MTNQNCSGHNYRIHDVLNNVYFSFRLIGIFALLQNQS